MIPRPKTAILVNAPPENRLRYAMTPPLFSSRGQGLDGIEVHARTNDVVPQAVHPDYEQGEQDFVGRSPIRKAAFRFRMLVGIGIAAASNCSWS